MQMILYLCINMTALLMVANTQGELKGKCDKTTFVIVSFLCNPRDLAMLLLILIRIVIRIVNKQLVCVLINNFV